MQWNKCLFCCGKVVSNHVSAVLLLLLVQVLKFLLAPQRNNTDIGKNVGKTQVKFIKKGLNAVTKKFSSPPLQRSLTYCRFVKA